MFARYVCRSVAVALLCVIILAIPLVAADETTESFTVYSDKEEYLVGEVALIYVKANSIDPNQTITVTDIIVYDPANNTVAEWHNLSVVLTDTATPVYVGSIMTQSEGSFTVSAEATGCPWILRAFWWFFCWKFWKPHVIPEIPFGTVIALTTLLGATGLYIQHKKRPEKTK